MDILPRTIPFRRILTWLLLILLLITGGIWVFQRLQAERPTAAVEAPANGSVVLPGLSPIQIGFTKTMNPGSVQEALTVTREDGETPIPGLLTWDGTTLFFTPQQPWPAGETIRVSLSQQARSRFVLRLAQPLSFQFNVAGQMLAYLWPAYPQAGQVSQLYALDPISGQTAQLVDAALGVLDYSVNPDGSAIYYATPDPDGGTVLIELNRLTGEETELTRCPLAACLAPVAAPGETRRLAFENTTTFEIWQIVGSEPPQVLFKNARHPAWSNTGWLAVYSQDLNGYTLLDPQTGQREFVPNQTGEPGTWSPDGTAFLAGEITTGAASRLALFDLAKIPPAVSGLGAGSGLQSADRQALAPVYAPNGLSVAFAHKYLDARWTRGSQIWLVDADGRSPRPLTSDPLYHHTSLAWSPSSQWLAFVRFNESTLSDPPEIWLLATEGAQQPIRLVINAHSPRWVP